MPFSVSNKPVTNVPSVSPAAFQSNLLMKPVNVSPIDFPKDFQSNLCTNVCAALTAVFIPSAIVPPTSCQSVSLINPLSSVAIPLARCLAPLWILSQLMFFSAELTFLPIISPMTDQSSVARTSLILSAKLAILGSIFSVENISPTDPPEPLPPPESELDDRLFNSSNDCNCPLSFLAAFAALSTPLA